MAARVRPAFAPSETAWLVVPYRWRAAAGMAVTGAMMIGPAAARFLTGAGPSGLVGTVLVAIFGLLGALLLLGGFGGMLRRAPILTADAEGITASMVGFDRSRIGWSLVRAWRSWGGRRPSGRSWCS